MQLELKRLQREVGITFVVVTHDQGEAMSLADRIAVLDHGRVEQVDAPVAIYERPATPFVARFVGANNLFEGAAAAGGVAVDGLGLLPAAVTGPAGSAAWIGIRPERIEMVDGSGYLRGRVRDVSYQGGTSTIVFAVPGAPRPVILTRPGPPSVTVGGEHGLRWDPAHAVVLAGDRIDSPHPDSPGASPR